MKEVPYIKLDQGRQSLSTFNQGNDRPRPFVDNHDSLLLSESHRSPAGLDSATAKQSFVTPQSLRVLKTKSTSIGYHTSLKASISLETIGPKLSRPTPTTMPQITLWFLQASRSIRTAWLLEELGLDHDLKFSERANQKAPEDFKIN
ncbi:hypothetical protein IAQ61_008354 [Plenodomus lingam]|uniref:uncharacterized protein n=1 Tax=Leptosphaeria maculans TaxID=5022 RepID=UPI00332798C0|nr:hypothetical protein IAQ61_008354 [Plenodomus lingam]